MKRLQKLLLSFISTPTLSPPNKIIKEKGREGEERNKEY